MHLLDPRRLTGPNLLDLRPLVLVDLGLDASEDLRRVRATYLTELTRMRAACGWAPSVELRERSYRGGAWLAFPGPIDTLLASVEMAEWAALSAAEVLAGRTARDLEPKRAAIAGMIADERNPALLALQAEASRRGVPCLWDDSQVSLGLGRRSQTWPRSQVPPLEAAPWAELGSIPVTLITGTNGKTTCARLLARCAKEAGLRAGVTSTDAITVDGAVIETGDMSGPIAARQVLRQHSVDFAVLETARGGILRRGLAVEAADGALITNVSSDHLGDYGIDDVPTMARVKAVTAQVVKPSGQVVLNALDANLMALRPGLRAPVALFSRDPEAPAVREHRARGGATWVLRDGGLYFEHGEVSERLVGVDEVPIAYGGAALHNVENALAVAALAAATGLPRDAVVRALRGFHSREDNPRRANLAEVGGVQVLLDFGHNPEGVRSALAFAQGLRKGRAPGRLAVITGHAGDRTEEDIAQVARIILDAKPELVIARDIEGYLRGKAPGEVPERFHEHFRGMGLAEGAFRIASSEVEALRMALDWAHAGDFVALLVYLDAEGDAALLSERGATYPE